jgi:hypothetical protein
VSVLAVSAGIAILALIGLAVGLGLAAVIVGLFNRVVRPALEIDRYAKDILVNAQGISANLEAVEALGHTRDLATALPALATAYLEQVETRLPR